MVTIFDGKKTAAKLEQELHKKIIRFQKTSGITPKLISILVGDDPGSVFYTKMKMKKAESLGIEFVKKEFLANVEGEELISTIRQLNKDNSVNGIMIQLPLPQEVTINNQQLTILNTIDPRKDVDCLTSENLKLVKQGNPRFLPATVSAINKILLKINSFSELKESAGTISPLRCERKYCVVGASGMVGKPMADYLESLGEKIFRCDEFTSDISVYTKQADVIISCTGVPNLIKKEMVKSGVIVIDVGYPKGDVDFENVKEVASFITPVPGGVGPMTVISLLENLYQSLI